MTWGTAMEKPKIRHVNQMSNRITLKQAMNQGIELAVQPGCRWQDHGQSAKS